eukprot:2398045-Heterocapsa_arctica.AAC.1
MSRVQSGVQYSKRPNGRWDPSPQTSEPDCSEPTGDKTHREQRVQLRGADPKRRADRRRHIPEGIRPTGDGDEFDPDDDGRGVGRMPSPLPPRNRKPRPPPAPPPAPD